MADRPPVELDISAGPQDFLSITLSDNKQTGQYTYNIEVRAPDGQPLYHIQSSNVVDRTSLAILIAQKLAKDEHFGFGRDQMPYRWIGTCWAPVEKWMMSLSYSMHVLVRTSLNSRDSSLMAETLAAWQATSQYPSDGLDLRAFGSCPGIPFEDGVVMLPERGRFVMELPMDYFDITPHRPEHMNLRVLPVRFEQVHETCQVRMTTSAGDVDGHRVAASPYQNSLTWRFFESTLEPVQMHQLMRWFGFHLVSHLFPNPEKMMYLWGDGGNGKSQILWLLRGLVGPDACAELRLTDLRHSPNVELLAGKLAMIGSEANTSTELERLKSLISKEPQAVNPKYRDPYSFVPDCLITQASNKPPRFEEQSDAMARRVISLHLKRSFSNADDKVQDIAKKIIGEEYPFLVAFAMLGLRFIVWDNGFKVLDDIERESKEKVSEGNPFDVFADELEYGPFEIAQKELHRYYLRWCKTTGGNVNTASMKELLDQLERISKKADRRIKRDARSTQYAPSYWYDNTNKRVLLVPELQDIKKPEVVRGFRINNRNGLVIGQPLPAGSRDADLFAMAAEPQETA